MANILLMAFMKKNFVFKFQFQLLLVLVIQLL